MYVVSLPLQYGQVPGQVQYAPQAGVAYQQQPGVTYQPMVTTVVPAQIPITNVPTTKMPIFSLITSFIVTMVFFYWLPGFICLIPAIILGVAAMHKKENNDLVNARKLSILSFTLTIVHIITFPILVFAAVFGGVYGSICAPRRYYYYYYYNSC
jgi:hypothetical protein